MENWFYMLHVLNRFLFSVLLEVIIIIMIHGGTINIQVSVIPSLLHMDQQFSPNLQ